MTSEEIKERVSVRDVLQQHGIKVRRNMCSCPFHKDVNPSMAVYEKSVYCFSCHFSGDVFTLTQALDNCSFKEAFLSLGGEYKHSKYADFYREIKAALPKSKPKQEIPENETHAEMIQRWTKEAHADANKILDALRICYDADLYEPIGCDKWHYLKNMTGYLEELYDNDSYDWRAVEKILSEYAGKKRKTRDQLERELREEIEGSTDNGISTQ
jgi:hypothetical protein